MSRPFLVTGARGLLGQDLVRLAARRGIEPVALGRAELDVADPAAVEAVVDEVRPACIVNCAAFTDVDGAEEREPEAQRVNGLAPGFLAEAARRHGALVVHVSTDYVFAGDLRRPLREDDPVGPRSAYGRSKLAGEQAVAARGGDWLVVRSAWLYGRGGRNFVDTIRRKVEAGGPGERLRVVDDQVGSPTWSVSLASGLLDLVAARARGVVHFSNRGQVSWWGLARAIVEALGRDNAVEPITSAELNRRAVRPSWSVLDTARFEQATGRRPAGWREALGWYLAGAASEAETTREAEAT